MAHGPAFKPATALAAAALLAVATCPMAGAQPAADFYRGKTVNLLVGSGEGGGFDLSARLTAQVIGKYIPGNPTVVVQNMPGASGLRAAEYVYNVAPRDGTVICITQPSMVLHKVLTPSARFNPLDYTWIGRLSSFITYGVVWHTSPVQTMADAMVKTAILGGVGPSGPGVMMPTALNLLAGTKFTVVKGYKSASELGLAMERGEVNGSGSSSWEYVHSKRWVEQKLARMLFTIALARSPIFADVPTVVELARDQRGKSIMHLVASASDIGRAIIAPPGLPPDRAAALRDAFARTVRDADFLAEARRRQFEVEPLAAAEIVKIVADDMRMPADVVEGARAIIQREK
jgi:tripartite-type tricarboxylate transporter receptor subunit TctC